MDESYYIIVLTNSPVRMLRITYPTLAKIMLKNNMDEDKQRSEAWKMRLRRCQKQTY